MHHTRFLCIIAFASAFVCQLCGTAECYAQWEGREEIVSNVEKTFVDPPEMVRLDKTSRVWADKKNKLVVVDGYITLTNGQLEMLACPVRTKEHESIIALFTKAQFIHAGLLAVGAKKGKPVAWEPKYAPPTGSKIGVFALWKDDKGKKHMIDAREWVREVGTEKGTLQMPFVFAGSGFWTDPDDGTKHYMAEAGDLICVSNFSTATLDIPTKSSQANSGLMFATFTERIPKIKTPVRVVLQVMDEAKESSEEKASDKEKKKPKVIEALLKTIK